MTKFDKKVVLVTGGATGIGKAASLAFARQGAKVVIAGRTQKSGELVVNEIKKMGGEALFFQTDIAQEQEVARLIHHTVEAFGGLDVAFNNSGTEGILCPITDQSAENYDSVFNTNVKGVMLSMKYQIPELLKRGGGAIINNASIAGHIGFAGGSVYVASKHAVLGLTRCAALEFASQGIRINAVSPGAIETDMFERFTGGQAEAKQGMIAAHPIGRLGKPEEIANAVLWLASEESSFVIGHSLLLDGGYTAQ
jgi:NAD(P)-dependent dehydrogenase (short-subunit alcohol dehydrogenase family)